MEQNSSQTAMAVDNEQLQNLEASTIDRKNENKSRLSSIFTVIFSGFALLSDGYQIGVLSLVNVCFRKIYGDKFTTAMSTRIGNSLFVGCILGQIGFGFVCDRVGRKVGLMLTTFLVVLGAALCAGAYGANGSIEGLFWALTIYRGILGVGVGGEYPCSSASASEAADVVMPGRRGMLFVFVTNFVIDLGYVLSALVPLIVALCGASYEVIWRTSFAFGVLPPLSVMYFRFKMNNSDIFQKNAIKKRVPYGLILQRYWTYLLGTAGSWFFYNFISYPFGIFAGTIIDQAGGADPSFIHTAEWMLLLNFFYMPGSILGALASDRIGRKRTMTLGFFMQGVLGILMGVFYKDLLKRFPLFVVVYGIFMAFGEFGPGDMLGLVSAEIYPTAIRGTAYGWSAAVGKFGAFVGTTAFKPAAATLGRGDPDRGQSRVFILASCLALLGSLFTWFLIPDYSKRNLHEEDEDFRRFLESKGYDLTNFGDSKGVSSSTTTGESGSQKDDNSSFSDEKPPAKV